MATYRKERNLIYIQMEGSSGHYTFDLNTGIFLGVKGTAIKTNPKKSECARCFPRHDGSTNLTYILSCMFEHCVRPSEYSRYVTALGTAEKLDAINVPNTYLSINQLEQLANEIKNVAAYLKTLNRAEDFRYHNYIGWARLEKMKKKLGSVLDGVNANIVSSIIDHIGDDITDEEFTTCVYYLVRGKMLEYHGGFPHQLRTYIQTCRIIDKKPEKVNNFMREFVETQEYYNRKKTEYDDRKLNLSYARHKAAWEFTYGNYTVIIPTKGQDIVEEGQRMHHCVGGYVNSVVNGDDYIVFIRHKDTPDVPYITCEVYTDGRIGQYYLAYDRRITNAEDIAFRNEFAKHLNAVWGN